MPFIETGLVGNDKDENINHYGSIRLRVIGNGMLLPTFYGLDRAVSQELLPMPMSETGGREPTRLSNFKGQRALLRLETNKINDVMNVSCIILFVKPLYTEYPQ